MEKLIGKLHLKYTEVLVLAVFFLFSLRVINWFEYPYIVVGGDFRPPLVQEAFVKRVLYAWNEIDFGIPSVYSPRILDPFYLFITVFQTLGVNLYLAQIITVFLMYFFASIFMYVYVKQLTDGDVTAGFIAALFLTSNIHLISDREQTAVGFLDATLVILPCLVIFTEGIKTKSYKLMAVSALLFALTYGTFPNYRASLICLITLALTCIYLFMARGIKISHRNNGSGKFLNISFDKNLISTYLKLSSVFAASLLLASIWIIAIISINLNALFITYKEMAAPLFTIYIKPHDVLRLIARWGFYESALRKPYVPYANVYLHDPLIIILSYLPPILAFTSLLTSNSRKLTIFFSGVAVLSLILTSAFNPYFNQLYFALATYIPLMMAFRESTHWMFFVILSYSVLIGITLSTLCRKFRNKALQILALSLAILLFLSASYPLITGDVTRNWLNPKIKGSYFPSSYVELNTMLSSQYWAVMLPQRGTYVVYDFTEGPLGCGNPYPLIFSKPIISGAGTEYVQSENPELINKLHELIRTNISARALPKFLGMLGIKYLILEKNIRLGNAYNVSELELHENENFILAKEWNEVSLLNNTYALQKLYVADNLLNYTTINEMYKVIENSEWNALQKSVFVNSTSINKTTNKTLAAPENFVWKELSPTSYEAHAESKSTFILVFLESYDPHWKLCVNGNNLPETSHLKVNAFANSWLINETGNLAITIQYETQNILAISVVASLILPTILLTFLSRREIKRVASLIQRRLKRKIDQAKGSADAK